MPASMFVLGYDTFIRLVNPRYYEDSVAKMESALLEIAGYDCGFVVSGRTTEGQFVDASAAIDQVPAGARDMFKFLTEQEFRNDVSST